MRVAVTGATGLVGHWIAGELLAAGHDVVAAGRRPAAHAGARHLPWALGQAPDLAGCDALVHAALSHLPGRYRGGEGGDPEGFRRLNGEGTVALFEAAAAAGVGRIVLVSSRAVYGAYPPGTALHEGLAPRPDTLYGAVKLEAEAALAALAGVTGTSLRATGVFGQPPRGPHKWQPLFERLGRGAPCPPRIGTEVLAADLARAVGLVLEAPPEAVRGALNVSDLVLDRRDLVAEYAAATGRDLPLPPASDPATVSAMTTDRLRGLGWRPAGLAGLRAFLARV